MRERVKIFLVVDLYKWCILNYLCVVVVVVVGTREFHNWVVFNFVYIYLEEARDERERCARREVLILHWELGRRDIFYSRAVTVHYTYIYRYIYTQLFNLFIQIYVHILLYVVYFKSIRDEYLVLYTAHV